MSPVQESGADGVQKAISSEEKKRLFYGKIDELYAGSGEDKEDAMRMLQDNEINVRIDVGRRGFRFKPTAPSVLSWWMCDHL